MVTPFCLVCKWCAALAYARQGWQYPVPEYICKEYPKTVIRKKSQIEYRIRCTHCGGTEGWVRRRDAKLLFRGV